MPQDHQYELAAVEYQQGLHDEALKRVQKVLEGHPRHAPSLHLAAAILFRQDQRQAALDHALRAVEVESDSVRYLKTLAQIQSRLGLHVDSLLTIERGLQHSPDNADLLRIQAESNLQAGQARAAIRALQKVIAIEPRNIEARLKLGDALRDLGQTDAALEYYRQAIVAAPEDARPHYGAALALQNQGAYDESIAAHERAHALNPSYIEPLVQLARVRKAQPDDPAFGVLEALIERQDLTARGQAMIGFALGKMYDDCAEYDRAFAHFAAANRQRERIDVGPSALDELRDTVEILERCCDESFFADRQDHGDPSQLPVFVVGMPRSGTTLIETILSCHPAVHGAGELPHVGEIQSGLMRSVPPADWEPLLTGLRAIATQKAGAKYADYLQSLSPASVRVVDKMPRNFQRLWLIALLFPNARILHARRDPVDTCLSCFFTDFSKAHNYRNDLATLGSYYRLYERLMDHWRRVCPLKIHEVQYEDVIANQESASRRMIDFLDLEWHPDCLDFHKHRRVVQTASDVQVGRELYRSSVRRSRNYEKHLSPLLDALAED